MRKKKSEQQAASPPRADGRVTPMDVQQVEFRLAFRGYNERDVDAFLDRLTEDLSWYLEENQRLRAGGSYAPPAAVPSEDVRGEAEAILARARDEAATIVRRAEQDAAAIRAGGGTSGDSRAAVAPFLNVEREFLQSLGTLVQTHAEEIKRMVLALRAASAAPPPVVEATPEEAAAAAPEVVEVAEPAGDGTETAVEAATAAEIRERLGEPAPEDTQQAQPVVETATEPAYSHEGAPAGEGRERSLRELFWGDD